LKQHLVAEKGITLITIPYWWDRTLSRYFTKHSKHIWLFKSQHSYFIMLTYLEHSLATTIIKMRPDLGKQLEEASSGSVDKLATSMKGDGIPQKLPVQLTPKRGEEIVDIGQPITAGFFTLSNVNPIDWYLPSPSSPSLPFSNSRNQKVDVREI